MTHRTQHAPPDLEMMRETARLVMLMDDGGELPDGEGLVTFALTLRGMLAVLVPEVEARARPLPADDVPRACALACVGEARMRERLEDVRPAVVVRLARSVNALCDHYKVLAR
ncbi:DUF6415 family natural product biosynthesis protein [Streptomyces sp. NPDC048188]|uniref:DUF6415 family natural product biosynthesis protein n=1 Tax=Streptomyces sp. NPDC048188 TaxID=3155749 RepID=UPI0034278DCB